jgi:hypothetical protein
LYFDYLRCIIRLMNERKQAPIVIHLQSLGTEDVALDRVYDLLIARVIEVHAGEIAETTSPDAEGIR